MANKLYEKLSNCVEAVRSKTDFVPDVALVLGSGLGNYAENIKVTAEIEYKDIPGFPVSTVPGRLNIKWYVFIFRCRFLYHSDFSYLTIR